MVQGSYTTFAEYQDKYSDATFTEWLKVNSEPDWSNGVNHKFVEELSNGTINKEAFGRYLIQDRAFVNTLFEVIGHAIADAPTIRKKQRIHQFFSMLIGGDVDGYFKETFSQIGVPREEWVDPDLHSTTEGLMDTVKRGAEEGGYEETLAVLFPTGWFYLAWGEQVSDANPGKNYLRKWIDIHTDSELKSFVDWQHRELNRLGPEIVDRRQQKVCRHFRRVAEYEKAFFDIAYES